MVILILMIPIIFLLFLLLKKTTPIKSINILITAVCSLIVLFIILSPEICFKFSINGAKLFFYNVFPYVFPFMILSNLIIYYGGVEIYSKFLGILCKPQKLPKNTAIVLAISALCGYPLGAKYSCDLYEEGIIDFKTFERIINIASNAGPLFIVGSVGTSMLGSRHSGYILLASCYASCILMGILIPYKAPKMHIDIKKNNNIQSENNFGVSIKKSVENAIQVSIQLMGFIVFFSLLIGILKNSILFKSIQNPIVKSLILGCIEMTNGCSIISTSQISFELKMLSMSFLICFGGFCVISQIYSFVGKYKVSPVKFILRKLVQGFLGSLICFILISFSPKNDAKYTFNFQFSKYNFTLYYTYLIIIFLVPIFSSKFSRRKH
ncbi:sporulation integral membrane protein YlbJ [Clostridium neuense]|uniref:Sporulation integral membrane protein YlbJ n=1 Tax=Clostridium neuense TaxID=1728934 RepID=A0ABW8TDU0_9CLOT